MTSMRAFVVLGVLAAVSACGGKTDHAAPPPPSDSGSIDTFQEDVPQETIDSGFVDPDATVSPTPPSCSSGAVGAGDNCGVAMNDDCCASPSVPGGSFLRFYDGVKHLQTGFPAQISTVRIDRYEITVGRFRAFVKAFDTWKPSPGDGAHPKVAGSGWQSGWPIAADAATLAKAIGDPSTCDGNAPTWQDAPGPDDVKPINCVTWYELFAFCAWDGGRLPTLAERMYAGVGGGEQRVYPWSSPPTSTTISTDDAIYSSDPFHPSFPGPLAVGMKPEGAGRWSHEDLGGNVAELLLDSYESDPPKTCDDCASVNFATNNTRALIGGSYASDQTYVQNAFASIQDVPDRSSAVGGRCARDE